MKKLKKKLLISKWLGLGLLIPSLLLNAYFVSRPKSDYGIEVMEVLDGDTLLLEGKTRLRLRQVDMPELDNCYGQEAKQLLEEMVKGKKITIQDKILDQRGRAMALVYLGDRLVNLELLKNGMGRYHSDKTRATEELKAAGAKAKAENLGVSPPECYQQEKNLEKPECIIKGNIDLNNQSIKRYYYPGCAQYKFVIVEKDKGEDWFCSEAEAEVAGYVKAKSCPEG